jgi:uncharacterized protein YrrD
MNERSASDKERAAVEVAPAASEFRLCGAGGRIHPIGPWFDPVHFVEARTDSKTGAAKCAIHERKFMLLKTKTLKGLGLDALDGEMGKVKDLYFDDQHWTVRYLVANTGGWLVGRRVLISPQSLLAKVKPEQSIAINLSKKQIESSPSIDADKPVSRQHEDDLHAYYGWPAYWGVGPYAGAGYPVPQYLPETAKENVREEKPKGDPHLRSMQEVTGYHIHATDGEIGHVDDFVIDDETWAIRYLIVDTKNWWPGKRVLVSPQWIERVSWRESMVFVNMSRETIKEAPEFTDESLNREYETGLYRHYDREGYWHEEDARHAHGR